MERSDFRSLASILQQYIKQAGFEPRLREVQIAGQWHEIVGRPMAQATRHIWFRNRKMYVQVTSSVVRAELSMIRESVVKRINELAGASIIDELVVR